MSLEHLGAEHYFSQFCQILVELFAIGVKLKDADLVQKSLPDSNDYFLSRYTSGGGYPTFDQLQSRIMLEESRCQTKRGTNPTSDKALYYR
uniref:Uncharacterized protein n=1 Tax=Physcomitrium patens TaxID=3218 RepID=A0A2K1L335_PHYPA|nr:hypothetical protein PHYPA_003224 [Physcomitrium patens]